MEFASPDRIISPREPTGSAGTLDAMGKRAAFILIALTGALLDLSTKAWAFHALEGGRTIVVIPGWLNWREGLNPGIVWGLFQKEGRLFVVLSSLAVPVIVVLFLRTRIPSRLFTAALGLILAGTLGNLHDRVVYGAVRDFIDFHVIHYPIFNVADSMICVGVGCLAWEMYFAPSPPRAGEAARDGPRAAS